MEHNVLGAEILEPKSQEKRPAKRGRPATSPETDAGPMRVRLPQALAKKVKGTILKLKERGGSVSVEDLLSDYLDQVPESYFELQLEKRTPERFWLEAALELPEAREKLLRQARRALSEATSGVSSPTNRRRRAEKVAPFPAVDSEQCV